MILQDDCLPVTGFPAAADAIREVRPEALLIFCLQGMAQQITRIAFWRAMETGQRLIEMRPQNWVPAMALGWTTDLAERCLAWDATANIRDSETSDDGRLYRFVGKCRVSCWLTVPCIVDHPDDTPSLTGAKANGRPGRRPLALYGGDASQLVWE